MAILKNKKAAEMTIGTIIIIVLALVVLVFLIFAFSRGTGSLNDYISNLFSGGSNIDTIKNSCNAVCASQAVYSYCEEVRTLKTSQGTFKGSCSTLGNGIEACQSITCTAFPKKCEDLGGVWLSLSTDKTICDAGKGEDKLAEVGNSDGIDTRNNKCCTVTCNALKGQWSPTICAQGKTDLTSQVKYLQDKGTNKFCCLK